MCEYPKIQTIFKRNPETKFKTVLEGEFSEDWLEYLQYNEWIFTEKVDGTNIRVLWKGNAEDISFKGKTDRAQLPAQLVAVLEKRFLFREMWEKFFETFDGEACLYGEGYGAKIQKGGGNYRPDQDFVLFDVKVGDWWLKREDVEDVAKKLGIDIVPIVGKGDLWWMLRMVRDGYTSHWGDFLAEGIVARPATELRTRSGQRVITKLKHKDFLN